MIENSSKKFFDRECWLVYPAKAVELLKRDSTSEDIWIEEGAGKELSGVDPLIRWKEAGVIDSPRYGREGKAHIVPGK
jgi:hypothetical protein